MATNKRLSQFSGRQLREGILRNRHFDENHKIHERYLDIDWRSHRETLEDTKVDVFVQSNNLEVASLGSVDVTSIVGGRPIAVDDNTEGIVLGAKVELRKAGSEDFPKIDPDGYRVYGKIRHDDTDNKFYMDFFVPDGAGGEKPYTFDSDAEPVDFRFTVRTNLGDLPLDALVNGGSGFVEGATDAKAYMNLQQLMKDIYGAIGSLNGDGKAILPKSLQDQINELRTTVGDTDNQLREDLASDEEGKGASLIGVVIDNNYTGTTVQEVLTELAERLTETEDGLNDLGDQVTDLDTRITTAESAIDDINGQLSNLETTVEDVVGQVSEDLEERISYIENRDDRIAFLAEGGEEIVSLPDGKKARPKSLFLSVNGAIQAPGINYDEVIDPEDGGVVGIDLKPDLLEAGDQVFMWWKNMYLDVDTEGMEELLSIPVSYQVI